jgi:hypothetical protein
MPVTMVALFGAYFYSSRFRRVWHCVWMSLSGDDLTAG